VALSCTKVEYLSRRDETREPFVRSCSAMALVVVKALLLLVALPCRFLGSYNCRYSPRAVGHSNGAEMKSGSVQLNERTPLHSKSDEEMGLRYETVEHAGKNPAIVIQQPSTSASTYQRASTYISESSTFIQSQVKETQTLIVKSISSQLLPRPTFFCGICLEYCDKADSYSFTGGVSPGSTSLEGCGHEYCRDCLRG
jgi:hypothetical protein